MNSHSYLFCLLLLATVQPCRAQKIAVIDATTLSPIASAELLIDGASTGIYSNNAGVLWVNAPDSATNFGFYALGYKPEQYPIGALDTLQQAYLTPLLYNLREVSITEKKVPLRQEIGAITMDAQYISKLPTIFAEPDLLKSIQLLPGVSSVLENNVGLFVRGGAAQHSLITLDGATVYNPAHSIGFFSVVHPASVKSSTLYKEALPGELGGRASAYLDVQLKEGNYQQFKGAFSVGLISSYLDLQGPLSKGKRPTSFQFVGRTTYIDKMLSAFSYEEPFINSGFSDYSLKLSSKLSDHHKLTLAHYHSQDYHNFVDIQFANIGAASNWNNNVVSLKLSSTKSEKWFKQTSLTYTQYQIDNHFAGATHSGGLQDLGVNYAINAYKEQQLITSAGVQATLHMVSPGKLRITDSTVYNQNQAPFTLANQPFVEIAPYVNFRKALKNQFVAKGHFRLSTYVSPEMVSVQPEPRLQIAKQLPMGTIALSYDRLSQFMQLYAANITPMPTDMWFVSDKNIRPVVSNSLSLSFNQPGYERNYTIGGSLYYRHFSNITDIKAGGSAFINPDYASWLAVGNNHSFGFEFLLQKHTGSFTGWVSYTYSRSINQITGIVESGQWYRANHDRPHILNITANKRFKKWELNGVFVFQSGRPITMPLYTVGVISIHSERNEYRLPVHHRLDLSLIRYQKKRKHFQGSWMLSIYNVYSRRNVYNIQFNPITNTVGYLNLFPILPFLSYKAEIF